MFENVDVNKSSKLMFIKNKVNWIQTSFWLYVNLLNLVPQDILLFRSKKSDFKVIIKHHEVFYEFDRFIGESDLVLEESLKLLKRSGYGKYTLVESFVELDEGYEVQLSKDFSIMVRRFFELKINITKSFELMFSLLVLNSLYNYSDKIEISLEEFLKILRGRSKSFSDLEKEFLVVSLRDLSKFFDMRVRIEYQQSRDQVIITEGFRKQHKIMKKRS